MAIQFPHHLDGTAAFDRFGVGMESPLSAERLMTPTVKSAVGGLHEPAEWWVFCCWKPAARKLTSKAISRLCFQRNAKTAPEVRDQARNVPLRSAHIRKHDFPSVHPSRVPLSQPLMCKENPDRSDPATRFLYLAGGCYFCVSHVSVVRGHQ